MSAPLPPSCPDTTIVSLRPCGYLRSQMCVCSLGPCAVRSAFHGRQHKVIRWRPLFGGAPRSLSCPPSFSVSRCSSTSMQLGQTHHLSMQTLAVKQLLLKTFTAIFLLRVFNFIIMLKNLVRFCILSHKADNYDTIQRWAIFPKVKSQIIQTYSSFIIQIFLNFQILWKIVRLQKHHGFL